MPKKQTRSVKNTANLSDGNSGVRRSRRTSRSASSSREFSQGNVANKFRELYENPAVRYLAGGIAAAAFAKFSRSFSGRYPEIVNLLRNSLDSIETKLSEFKQSSSGAGDDAELPH